MSEKKQERSLSIVPSHIGQITESQHDAIFGEITREGPNYRSVGWLGTCALMLKTQIGLGVLSIPSAFDALGVVPGVICLCAIAGITSWSNYIIGVFKIHHRDVYGIDDVGGLLLGRPGRIFFGGAFILWWTFVAGSGMLSMSIGLNAVSDHAVCTAVYVAISAIVACALGSIQTLGRISSLAWVGLGGIITAIMIVTIAVGIQDHPAAVPDNAVWVPDYKIVGSPSFIDAIVAVSTLVFAYAGTPAFFSIVAEMREPQYYNRALSLCQTIMTCFYIAIGVVIYYYCGSYVSSPALGSAGPVVKKVSYGFALPGLLVSTLLFIHITAKYILVHILKGSRHLASNTVTHWVLWLSCTIGVALVAYVIASAIPVFSDLVALVGALLGTPMCFQPMGGMWLYDNWKHGNVGRSRRWTAMVCWCIFIILTGTFLMIAGTYGSVVNIIDSYRESGGTAAWSCVDNSAS
ncbi:transmembrane amino acid transporter protein-domain-containing protein [Aspergillus welwitschiae]|uniref:Transmembrane amino acid transporter protein-domain-containing protein n=1 Tax=Aspergillus welwitschiae TaxID=1341132 RepID=A0A3F3PKU2_9EURO|nr:transmembrane amino acid transporter protein-domain-containing protein [Aspergillus welwitschiae]RDH26956.1 transmembrane amino acid transporter protein-domain-containing protein [Aspergillus welwitschiae]